MPNPLDPAALRAALAWGPFKVEWKHLSRFVLYAKSVPNSAEGAERVARLVGEALNDHAPAILLRIGELETACAEMAAALEFIAEQGCERFESSPDECSMTDDCVTEYCLPCYADAALARYRKEEKGD